MKSIANVSANRAGKGLVLFITVFCALFFNNWAHCQEKVLVFAAASTTNAITDIGAAFEKISKVKVSCSFASSSTLAKQIENKAPANIYVSANPKWMDYLEDKGEIEEGTRTELLGNSVVLISPVSSMVEVKIQPGFKLAEILGPGKLAMGDPDHVPAGIYAKQALETLGVWETVKSKVARSKDVRAALALVERAEAPLGIVYSTDAKITEKVRVIGTFPENSHPPVRYPVAIVKGNATKEAMELFGFMKSKEAGEIFEKYGFTFLRD